MEDYYTEYKTIYKGMENQLKLDRQFEQLCLFE